MAHCLRHITNKFTSLTSLIKSTNFIIECDKSVVNLQHKLLNSERYSTQISPASKTTIDDFSYIETLTDNRESKNDVITKEHLLLTSKLQILQGSPISIIYFVPPSEDSTVLSNEPKSDVNPNKPSPEKLSRVYDVLRTTLPDLFTKTLDYSIYHPDMVFENNIRGLTTVGLYNYVKQIALLRTVGHLKFAYVRFELLKITKHPEDSTIRARWRIRGISAFRVMTTFWKYKIWKYKEMFEKTDAWYDGFSTFHVNADGQIYKHVADKMMPDQETETVQTGSGDLGAAKLTMMTCLIPRFTDICSFT